MFIFLLVAYIFIKIGFVNKTIHLIEAKKQTKKLLVR